MTSFGLFSPFLEFVLMTNPPLINLRIAPYVKAGHIGGRSIQKWDQLSNNGFCRFTRLFFCIPAPEVLSAASLRSAFRRYGEVISRSDGYSVVKDRGERMPSIFFGQRGVKIHPCCRKKYSVFCNPPHFLIGTKKDKTATRPSTFLLARNNQKLAKLFCEKWGENMGRTRLF